MLRTLARVLLVAAFLLAQASGVAHQVWHAGSLAAQATVTDAGGDGKAPKKSPLCDFHAALGAVLGAVSGSGQSAEAAVPTAIPFIAADSPAARFSALAPQSRGPPALL